jgi:hypothetical protein
MGPGWKLLADVIGAVASIVVILDYFGIKPTAGAWGSIMALNQKWKLAIMLGLVGLMLFSSGYGFYRSLRPKIIEKIVTVTVEKPVDRIVEREVPQKCPTCPKCTKSASLTTKPPAPLPQSQECALGAQCAQSSGQSGGFTGQLNIDAAEHLQMNSKAADAIGRISRGSCPIQTIAIAVIAANDETGKFAEDLKDAITSTGMGARTAYSIAAAGADGPLRRGVTIHAGNNCVDIAKGIANGLVANGAVHGPRLFVNNVVSDEWKDKIDVLITSPN